MILLPWSLTDHSLSKRMFFSFLCWTFWGINLLYTHLLVIRAVLPGSTLVRDSAERSAWQWDHGNNLQKHFCEMMITTWTMCSDTCCISKPSKFCVEMECETGCLKSLSAQLVKADSRHLEPLRCNLPICLNMSFKFQIYCHSSHLNKNYI